MPLNETPCPRCNRRVHVMAGINVLPNFPQSVFLVCWKCKIIAHPREDHNQGSKGGSPELCRYRHVIVPAAVLALCAIALAVLAASPVVWLPVDMGWK